MARFISSIRKLIYIVLGFLFPIIASTIANKIITKKMRSLEKGEGGFEYMIEWDSLTFQQIQSFYNDSIEQMKSLESKAQISIVGLTIAISLFGISISLLSNQDFFVGCPLQISVIIFGILSLSYFIMSGCMSLEVLGERNKVYKLSPRQAQLSEEAQKEKLSLYTELNVFLNNIRYNYVYSAYRSILYAMISLGIMFVLFSINAL